MNNGQQRISRSIYTRIWDSMKEKIGIIWLIFVDIYTYYFIKLVEYKKRTNHSTKLRDMYVRLDVSWPLQRKQLRHKIFGLNE